MDDKDLTIQRMRSDLAKWKNRTHEAASECCERCEMIFKHSTEKTPCEDCRIKKIREEALR